MLINYQIFTLSHILFLFSFSSMNLICLAMPEINVTPDRKSLVIIATLNSGRVFLIYVFPRCTLIQSLIYEKHRVCRVPSFGIKEQVPVRNNAEIQAQRDKTP